MRCQYCNCLESKVIDSRPTEEGNSIRRRRECMKCGRRFTTYEKIELSPLLVVKRDNRREPFDASKIKAGIIHACEKLPVSMQQIDAIVARIEQAAYNSMDGEISSQRIGDMVMSELKVLNEVAYVRFAAVSVHRSGELHGGAHPPHRRKQSQGRRLRTAGGLNRNRHGSDERPPLCNRAICRKTKGGVAMSAERQRLPSGAFAAASPALWGRGTAAAS